MHDNISHVQFWLFHRSVGSGYSAVGGSAGRYPFTQEGAQRALNTHIRSRIKYDPDAATGDYIVQHANGAYTFSVSPPPPQPEWEVKPS